MGSHLRLLTPALETDIIEGEAGMVIPLTKFVVSKTQQSAVNLVNIPKA